MSDLTNPASQWSAHQPADGQQPLPALSRQAVLRPGRRSASRMKAISLALAVAAALVFFVSLANRQLTIATAIATVVLMLAALLNYGRLARRRG